MTYISKKITTISNDDYIICIDNILGERFIVLQDFNAEGIPTYIKHMLPLTLNKIYKILEYQYRYYVLEDDLGNKVEYRRERFKTITKKQLRILKINELI